MKISKLCLSLLATFCLGILVSIAQKPLQKEYYMLVGTYTKKTSEGIYVYKFNTETGDFSSVSVAKDIKNPSFLAISPDEKKVYSVGEVDGGAVLSFSFDKAAGSLTPINSQASEGANPCHIELDKTGKWAFVGNYTGGNLSVLPILKDGSLGKAVQTINHEGKSINEARQEKPHVHSINISADNKQLFVPDLGIDKVMIYNFDAKLGKLSAANPVAAEVTPGSGPRHFTFHPNNKFAYVIQELNASITAFAYQNGKLVKIQTVDTLPTDFKGNNSCADIHISADGRFLYGSNRFHDTLVIFEIDPKTGKLSLVGHQSVMGKTPRNFSLDPSNRFVLVANQDSDNIVIFKRDTKTGKLSPTGKEIAVSMPVCIKWLGVK